MISKFEIPKISFYQLASTSNQERSLVYLLPFLLSATRWCCWKWPSKAVALTDQFYGELSIPDLCTDRCRPYKDRDFPPRFFITIASQGALLLVSLSDWSSFSGFQSENHASPSESSQPNDSGGIAWAWGSGEADYRSLFFLEDPHLCRVSDNFSFTNQSSNRPLPSAPPKKKKKKKWIL